MASEDHDIVSRGVYQQYPGYMPLPVLPSSPPLGNSIQQSLDSVTPQIRGKPKSYFPGGWHTGVIGWALWALIVVFINTGLTIWAVKNYGEDGGIGTVYAGSCTTTKKMSMWLHLGINALATVLLSGSNYTMQCLSAPTREEVDKAHACKLWVDIGVSSIRNLRRISWGKIVLWWCLGLSSVPLHLMYNSAIFSSLASNVYLLTVVPEDYALKFLGNYQNYERNKFETLGKRACMQTYGMQFVSASGDVIIVVTGNGTDWVKLDRDFLAHGLGSTGTNTGRLPYDWICNSMQISGPCNINTALANADSWAIEGASVQYCLSQNMDEKCSLQFSRDIMILVIICNVVKFICMVLVVLNSKEPVLVTIGDAISSFLDIRDQTTLDMCVATKWDIQNGYWESSNVFVRGAAYRAWNPHRYHWFRAVSIGRWVICIFLFLLFILVSLILLWIGMLSFHNYDLHRNLKSLWGMGFGAVDIRALAILDSQAPSKGFRGSANIIVANLPQLCISVLYLLYNSIITPMLLGDEWDQFSYDRKTLRVTLPTGGQRSTYFLSVPYKYSVPLMAASGLMHWLVSQSMFLARVVEYRGDTLTNKSITAVGYSPIAIYSVVTGGFMTLLVALVLGLQRYKGMMPVVGSCSAVISAACHPDPQTYPSARLPLQWGVISTDGDIGHCSFSSGPVSPPVPGGWYAGTASACKQSSSSEGTDGASIRSCGQHQES